MFACEITPTEVIGARAAATLAGRVDQVSVRPLPAAALVPSLLTENILQREAVKEAAHGVLEAIGAQTSELIVIVPDAACRIALLDFDTLPERKEDAHAMVRFRLKKALPFDAEKAAISYHTVRDAGGIKMVAAVMLDSVLNDYESLFRELGCQPGVVMPSTISALAPYSPLWLLISTLFLVAVCWATNTLFAKTFQVPANVESVYISALILALIITPAKSPGDLWFLFLGRRFGHGH